MSSALMRSEKHGQSRWTGGLHGVLLRTVTLQLIGQEPRKSQQPERCIRARIIVHVAIQCNCMALSPPFPAAPGVEWAGKGEGMPRFWDFSKCDQV